MEGELVEAQGRVRDLVPGPDVEGVREVGDLRAALGGSLLPRVLLQTDRQGAKVVRGGGGGG